MWSFRKSCCFDFQTHLKFITCLHLPHLIPGQAIIVCNRLQAGLFGFTFPCCNLIFIRYLSDLFFNTEYYVSTRLKIFQWFLPCLQYNPSSAVCLIKPYITHFFSTSITSSDATSPSLTRSKLLTLVSELIWLFISHLKAPPCCSTF